MLRIQLLGGIQLAAPDDRELRPLVGRPKRFAVLAYLAAQEEGRFVRRDTLIGLFWPEMDQAGARKAVRQALYTLRTDLGEDVFETAGDDEVRLAPGRAWCDVPAFLDAVAARRLEEALELYRGDLLPSFFVPDGAPGFEQWLEEERGRLRALAAKAAWDLAESAERSRKSGPAATFGRQALALTHDDETALRRLIQLFDRLGDRAGALRAYETFARRLKAEYGDEPSPETQALIAQVREREVARRPAGPVAAPEPPPSASPAAASTAAASPAVALAGPPAAGSPGSGAPRSPALGLAGVLLVLLGTAAAWWWTRAPRPEVLSDSNRVTTQSEAAREHYRRGLEAWFSHGDHTEARRELEAALTADSTFAMAAYWLAVIIDWRDGPLANRYLAQAVRMAPRTHPDEQRLIALQQALAANEPEAVPAAELLATEYPRDVNILIKASQVLLVANRLERGAALARQAIALDSAPQATPGAPCPKCEGYRFLSTAQLMLDSLPEAEETVRRWRRDRPDDVRAERAMVNILDWQGRYAEADALTRSLVDRGRGSVPPAYFEVQRALLQGDLPTALARSLADSVASGALPGWLQVTVLRHAGRLREATRVVAERARGNASAWEPLRLQVAWEAGDTVRAHALADTLLRRQAAPFPGPGGASPRDVAWGITRATTILAGVRDTAALALASQRLTQLGALSGFGRDQRAAHYPRGLRALLQGDSARAEAELAAAMLAPAAGYTRINVELAGLLTARGRAAEALPLLRGALHTDHLGGSEMYVTTTELHAALARAFAALGQADSAAAHATYVDRMLVGADQGFRERVLGARPGPP